MTWGRSCKSSKQTLHPEFRHLHSAMAADERLSPNRTNVRCLLFQINQVRQELRAKVSGLLEPINLYRSNPADIIIKAIHRGELAPSSRAIRENFIASRSVLAF